MFQTYVEQVLGPTLQPGDIVVMDNLAVHKVAGIAQAIAVRGARGEYLPPYFPDLNPIEKCWAKLKTALRQAKALPERHSKKLSRTPYKQLVRTMPSPGSLIVDTPYTERKSALGSLVGRGEGVVGPVDYESSARQ